MEIIRPLAAIFLSLAEKIFSPVADGFNFQEYLIDLKKVLDELGAEAAKTILENLDQELRESKARKQEWIIVKNNAPKEILTPFGPVSYERTYYRHKESGTYSHLVDEKAGITPHSRLSLGMKAELTAVCSDLSYERATDQLSRHNPALKVSKQTASNYVRAFQATPKPPPKEKRHVERLYVEADEDHVKLGSRRGQVRLVYVHEGVVQDPRPHLVNARYFTTVRKSPEEFWTEVLDYLDSHYDLESVNEIFLSGDGAPWIQAGKEYIPNSIFLLDKFHLSKSIVTATAHAKELKKEIYKGIGLLDKEHVMRRLAEALELAKTEPRQKRVLATVKYIGNNWDGIKNGVIHSHVGCSAEGHVSHILSARLSSRPMAWSLLGAERMALIRATRANGESIQEHIQAASSQAPVIIELKTRIKKELKHLKKGLRFGKEYLNNAPVYSGGHNLTSAALKGLNSITAI